MKRKAAKFFSLPFFYIIFVSSLIILFNSTSIFAQEANNDDASAAPVTDRSNISLPINVTSDGLQKNNETDLVSIFKSAFTDYRQGQFSPALDKFLKIYKSGVKDYALFYNMGNCYYRLNRLGLSVLMWEKALTLKPKDEMTTQNLIFASRRLIDKFEPQESHFIGAVLSAISKMISLNGWTICTIILFWAGCAFLFIVQKTSKAILKRVSLYLVALFILLVLISGSFTVEKYIGSTTEKYGILLVDRIEVRSGPAQNNPSLFMLHEGTKVKIEGNEGDWLRISIPNGYNGWIPAAGLGII